MRPKYLSIAIVGCGIAGMAAGIALMRIGHRVTIFERFSHQKPVGAGLLLQPTGQAALRRLGVLDQVISSSSAIQKLDARTTSGSMILDLDYSRLSPELRGYGISRNALFSALFGALSRCGGSALELHTNATVKAVSPSGEVTLTDGRTGRFDLVLVADGAHSSLRRFISSVRRDAIYPWGCLWANISLPSPLAPDTLHQRCLSTRVMVGVLPIGRLEDAKATQAAALFWSLRNDTADQVRSAPFSKLRDEIVSLWPELAESLAGLHNGHADFVHATYRDVWVDPPFSGRMLFIGDAGHGTSPQLGQGANLALEDAVTLGMALEGATEDTLPQRLKSYWRARRDPLLYYRRASWLLTPFFQSDMRLLGFLRDTFAPLGRLRFVDYLNVTTLAGIRTGFLPGRVRADPDAACLWLEK